MPAPTSRARPSNASTSNGRTGHYGRNANGRRPRSTAQEEEEEEEEPQPRRRRVGEPSERRRRGEEIENEEDEEEVEEEEEEEEEEVEGGDDGEARAAGLRPLKKFIVSEAIENMVKGMDKEATDGLKRKANDLARMALFSELRRTPLRRSDISAKVFNKENTRVFPVVFNRAQKILRSSFGYEMVELRARGTDNEQIMLAQAQTQTQRGRNAEKEGEKDTKVKGVLSKSYVLVSVLPTKLISRITQPNATLGGVPDFTVGGSSGDVSGTEGVLLDWKRSSADLGRTGLTMLILALVLVNNRVMPEDQLRSYLRRMGLKGALPQSLQSHPELASGSLAGRDSDGIMLDDFLANLVKQDYLERTRVQTAAAATSAASMDASMVRRRTQARGNVKRTRNGDSDVVEDFELRWGSRAEVEIGETAAASFIADICLKTGNTDPEEEEEEEEEGVETQNSTGSSSERQKKRREQILREVQRAAGSSLVV